MSLISLPLNPKLQSYLIIILYLGIGLGVMGIAQLFKTPGWLNPAFILLALFIAVNLITTKFFNLHTELYAFWTIRKIPLLPIGVVAGSLIAISPIFAGLLTGAADVNGLSFYPALTLSSICITLAIVAWEELWFRGIFLNYCNRNVSAINLSITIGMLFMLVHIMNPEIDLLRTGPALFFAGAFLTIQYFYFKTIWIPIGLHFGNNIIPIHSNLDKHWLYGSDGYFSALVLAVLFIVFSRLTIKKATKRENAT